MVENAKVQAQNSMDEVVKEVEEKCRELENSFFDLQMENLQLKKELEKYKNKRIILNEREDFNCFRI